MGDAYTRRRLSILMLDNEYPPLGGGTGVVNQHILEEWAKLPAVEVDLVTSSRTRATYEYDQLSPHIRIHKTPVDNHNIHHSTNRELLTYAGRGWAYARKLARQRPYDVCLAWAGVPAGGVALGLKWEQRLPYIVSLQGPDVPGFEERYKNIYRILTPFIRRVWRSAAALTACSVQHRELALRTIPTAQIQVIANGVDTQVFCPPATPRPTDGPVRIICAGRLIERKGQQYLLPAVATLRGQGLPVELWLVGTGDNTDVLQAQASTLELDDAVHFTGFVARDGMPALYQQSDIFVLPSFQEGMSIALLEAMATGLPAVVTDTGGTRELMDGNGMVAPWADVPALAEALGLLAASPELRRAMGRRSQTIAQRYNWNHVAQRYLNLCAAATRPTSAHPTHV